MDEPVIDELDAAIAELRLAESVAEIRAAIDRLREICERYYPTKVS